MERIKVKWSAEPEEGVELFDIEDFGIQSKEEWEALSDLEKARFAQQAIDEAPDLSVQIVYSINII